MTGEGALARWIDRFGLSGVARSPGPLILMYHGIGGSDGLPAECFAEQLEHVSQCKRVVTLERAVAALGTPEARDLAAITFDDGYRDFRDLAVPELRSRSLPATLFVPAGHMGGYNIWDEGVADRRDIMGAHELRELDPELVTLGAHGTRHCRMSGLDPSKLEHETRHARDQLEDSLGREIRLFAYPYGQRDDFDARAEHAVRAAGYEAACSTCFGRGSAESERFRLRRVGIEAGDDLDVFRLKLAGAYDFRAPKEALGARLRGMGR